jgi:putative ATPase
VPLNAVVHKVADLRRELDLARQRLATHGRSTLLFIDEVHRFTRAQQDVLLPGLERGLVFVIATTTENPNFALTSALLSRLSVFHLRSLSSKEVTGILQGALPLMEKDAGPAFEVSEEMLEKLARGVSGDVRQALTLLELAARVGGLLDEARLEELLETSYREYDRSGDKHYDFISAFIKSIRGSDPDAALYYLARMLEGGEDARFIARRLLISASEDVGNADPQALLIAVAGADATERIGLPEARITLAQVTTYLACAPKSNAAYLSIKKAQEAVKKSPRWGVPRHLQNVPPAGEKKAPYIYPHDSPDGFLPQSHLPRPLRLYLPKKIGAEESMRGRILDWDRRRIEAGVPVATPELDED